MATMSDLKACPFCGSPASTMVWFPPFDDDDDGLELGRCSNKACDARVPLELWNTRPEEDRLRSALQAAERDRDSTRLEADRERAKAAKASEAREAFRKLLEDQDHLRREATRHEFNATTARAESARLAQELTEARAAIAQAELACKDLLEKLDRLDKRVETVVAERDEARAGAGKLAEQVVEVTGKLVVADIENGRLREALEFYGAAETWRFRTGPKGPWRLIDDDEQGRLAREALGKP